MGVHYSRYAMPYEDSLGIFIARQRHTPIEEDWPKAKHFEWWRPGHAACPGFPTGRLRDYFPPGHTIPSPAETSRGWCAAPLRRQQTWPRTDMTRSWWAPAVPDPRWRCCSRIGYDVLPRGPRDVPERHDLDSPRAHARSGRAPALGPARPAGRTGLPADRDLLVRLRPVLAHRLAPHSRSWRSPTDRAAPCSTSCSIDAAAEAGAEVREGFTAEELVFEDGRVTRIRGHGHGGRVVTERARVVDRRRRPPSRSSRATVSPEPYHERPAILCGYYTYWSGLPLDDGFEAYDRRGSRTGAAWPTNDGLTLLIVGWPDLRVRGGSGSERRAPLPGDDRTGARVRRARALRQAREALRWARSVPNYFRKPYGPGWALVGRRRLQPRFVTAQGICDAFRDAELCATAIDAAFSATRSFEDAMGRIGPRATRCCRCTSSRTSSPASSAATRNAAALPSAR